MSTPCPSMLHLLPLIIPCEPANLCCAPLVHGPVDRQRRARLMIYCPRGRTAASTAHLKPHSRPIGRTLTAIALLASTRQEANANNQTSAVSRSRTATTVGRLTDTPPNTTQAVHETSSLGAIAPRIYSRRSLSTPRRPHPPGPPTLARPQAANHAQTSGPHPPPHNPHLRPQRRRPPRTHPLRHGAVCPVLQAKTTRWGVKWGSVEDVRRYKGGRREGWGGRREGGGEGRRGNREIGEGEAGNRRIRGCARGEGGE